MIKQIKSQGGQRKFKGQGSLSNQRNEPDILSQSLVFNQRNNSTGYRTELLSTFDDPDLQTQKSKKLKSNLKLTQSLGASFYNDTQSNTKTPKLDLLQKQNSLEDTETNYDDELLELEDLIILENNKNLKNDQDYQERLKKLKYQKQQRQLENCVKDNQICIIANPKIISNDYMPQIEIMESDFKEKKNRKVFKQIEAEENVIKLENTDFHRYLNKHLMKRILRRNLCSRSNSVQTKPQKVNPVTIYNEELKDKIYLNYKDLEEYIQDFHQEQKQLSFNSKLAQYIEDQDMAQNKIIEKPHYDGSTQLSRSTSFRNMRKSSENSKNSFSYSNSRNIQNRPRQSVLIHANTMAQNSRVYPNSIINQINSSIYQEKQLEQNQNLHPSLEQNPKTLLSLKRRGTVFVPQNTFVLVNRNKLIDNSIQNDFITKMPENIQENKYSVDQEVFARFQAEFMKTKKQMELSILKQNKRQESINKIAQLCEVQAEDRIRMQNRRSYDKVMKLYKTFKTFVKNKYKRRDGILICGGQEEYHQFKEQYLGFLVPHQRKSKSINIQAIEQKSLSYQKY
eukprot:403336988